MIYEIETDSEPETSNLSQASTLYIDSCSDGEDIHTEEVSEDSEDSRYTVNSSTEEDDMAQCSRYSLAHDAYCQIKNLTSDFPFTHNVGELELILMDCYQLLSVYMYGPASEFYVDNGRDRSGRERAVVPTIF